MLRVCHTHRAALRALHAAKQGLGYRAVGPKGLKDLGAGRPRCRPGQSRYLAAVVVTRSIYREESVRGPACPWPGCGTGRGDKWEFGCIRCSQQPQSRSPINAQGQQGGPMAMRPYNPCTGTLARSTGAWYGNGCRARVILWIPGTPLPDADPTENPRNSGVPWGAGRLMPSMPSSMRTFGSGVLSTGLARRSSAGNSEPIHNAVNGWSHSVEVSPELH